MISFFCFLTALCFISFQCISGDLFTGPGSFYKFSNESNYIGDRVVYAEEDSYMYYSLDFIDEIKTAMRDSKNNPKSFQVLSPRILQQSTSWLLIGDSTERKVVQTFCLAMKARRSKRVNFTFTDEGEYHAHCMIEITPKVTFQLANLFIFGYAEPTNLPLANMSVHPALHMKSSLTAFSIVSEALSSNKSPFLTLTFGSSAMPRLISMHSCLWDLNEHHGIHDKFYAPFLPVSYFEGAKSISRHISSLAPHSQFIIGTCKPINQIDSAQDMADRIAYQGKTRNRDSQTALDSMVAKLMMQKDNVIKDKVDMTMLLTGFESSFAPDGSHYVGKAALTIANAYLNSFERLLYPDKNDFLRTLRKESVKAVAEYVENEFLTK